MQWILIGLLLLVGAVYAMRQLATTNVADLARSIRRVGGAGAIGVGAILGLTGRGAIGLPLAAFGLMLLLRSFSFGGRGFGGGRPKSAGQRSRVRAARVEMTLDHDSGEMDGVVIGGPQDGRRLGEMSDAELGALWDEFQSQDPKSAQLLAAYLDRTRTEWREQHQTAGSQQRAGMGGSDLSRDEAYEILGLEPGASAAQIHAAHRALMKKLHPDRGGSTYLAAKVNQAKEILL